VLDVIFSTVLCHGHKGLVVRLLRYTNNMYQGGVAIRVRGGRYFESDKIRFVCSDCVLLRRE
jgi:hypothetical protein